MTDPDRPIGYLIDSSVLLGVATEDARWFDWTASALATATRTATINQPVDLRLTLITRDARRYRTYFPTLEITAPDPK